MTVTEIFLMAMVMIFAVPYLVWRIGKTDHYAPLVVVQIIAGILLGPGVLGSVFPDYYAFIFTPPVVQSLNGIAWWAVMVFVWIAGIELDLSKGLGIQAREQRHGCIGAGRSARVRLCRRCYHRQLSRAGSGRVAGPGSSCWAWACAVR